jgi:hypothetical protein
MWGQDVILSLYSSLRRQRDAAVPCQGRPSCARDAERQGRALRGGGAPSPGQRRAMADGAEVGRDRRSHAHAPPASGSHARRRLVGDLCQEESHQRATPWGGSPGSRARVPRLEARSGATRGWVVDSDASEQEMRWLEGKARRPDPAAADWCYLRRTGGSLRRSDTADRVWSTVEQSRGEETDARKK